LRPIAFAALLTAFQASGSFAGFRRPRAFFTSFSNSGSYSSPGTRRENASRIESSQNSRVFSSDLPQHSIQISSSRRLRYQVRPHIRPHQIGNRRRCWLLWAAISRTIAGEWKLKCYMVEEWGVL
jgi:hypothetical protein